MGNNNMDISPPPKALTRRRNRSPNGLRRSYALSNTKRARHSRVGFKNDPNVREYEANGPHMNPVVKSRSTSRPAILMPVRRNRYNVEKDSNVSHLTAAATHEHKLENGGHPLEVLNRRIHWVFAKKREYPRATIEQAIGRLYMESFKEAQEALKNAEAEQ